MLLVARQQGSLVARARHNPKGHIRISKAHPPLCVQFNHKLTNSLMTEAQLFRNLASPHRSIQQLEQAQSTGAREPAVPPQSIRNDLEATCFPARGRVPPFRLVLPGKSNPRQCSELSCGLDKIKLRLYRDFRLGVLATSERDQASCLRFG